MKSIAAFISGMVFAIGLGISGMTQPHKVIGFLDLMNWDPTLLFVMIGAIAVHIVAYPLVRRRRTPLLDTHWHVPTRKDLSPALMIGSVIFGLGWGLGGFCPGPALASLVTGQIGVITFLVSMILGMVVFRSLEKYFPFKR